MVKLFRSVVVIARCSARSLVQLWIVRVFVSGFWFGRLLLNLWLRLPTANCNKRTTHECNVAYFCCGRVCGCWEKFVHLKSQKHLLHGETVLVVVMARCGARSPLRLWILSVLWVNFGLWVLLWADCSLTFDLLSNTYASLVHTEQSLCTWPKMWNCFLSCFWRWNFFSQFLISCYIART